MYIIKVKGKEKIPDYVQIRDDNFELVSYFRADRPFKQLDKFGWEDRKEEFKTFVEELPYGKLTPFN